MGAFSKWLAGIAATVIAGVALVLITNSLPNNSGDNGGSGSTSSQTSGAPPSTSSPARPLSFTERISGGWTLVAWTEAGSPVTLGIEALRGTMTVEEDGHTTWRVDIQPVNQPSTPQPAIKCGGRTTLDGHIEGIPGGKDNEQIDWTSTLNSINRSSTGDDYIFRALCGWAVIGTRAPFTATLDGEDSTPATRMEMRNEYGTFRWARS